ncbi:MAG: hypothetical protein A2V83_04330 [Nitrospirae bacterium RBG_16_64_22]|nr:MAG: hypothetical protein A2V83_04330 [Nitrospirae bacterium RBG_16_64_22]
MPTLTRWLIKTALVYFVASLLIGVLLAARDAFGLSPALAALMPVYFHLLMVGWVTQLIFGVAFWMFPRYSKEMPRGREGLAWAMYASLNAGLLLRALSEPMHAATTAPFWAGVLVVSALLKWSAGLMFVANMWKRIREK